MPRLSKKILAALLLLTTLDPLSRADDAPVPPAVESAVDRALAWLAANQSLDGSWILNGSKSSSVAITSLSIMAFMSRGHTPGQGPYGDNINHAIDFVLSTQQPSGLLSTTAANGPHPMYDHGIASVMLCETFGMLDDDRQEKVRAAVAKAIRLTLTAQSIRKDADSTGGWRYHPTDTDSDISVSGWQLMSLRGAANIGADIPPTAIANGIAYIKRREQPDGGFDYGPSTGTGNPAPRTGTGILSLELLGQHNSKQSIAGGEFLLRNPPGKDSEFYFYNVYYGSQAAYQLGGKYWDTLGPVIRNSLLQRQQPNGSWSTSGSGIESQGGNAYATAMSILALDVPFRNLPIYQR